MGDRRGEGCRNGDNRIRNEKTGRNGNSVGNTEQVQKNETTKGELSLAKRRLSDDMDISSGSDDSDPDRTIPFVKSRPSTDQHDKAAVSINLKVFLFINTFLHKIYELSKNPQFFSK